MSRITDFLFSFAYFLLTVIGLVLISIISGLIVMKLISSKELVKVPQLKGFDINYALNQLDGLGLFLEIKREEYSKNIPINHVISQNPSDGEFLRRNHRVELIISKGSDNVIVPDLSNEPWLTAQALLKNSGFRIGTISWTHYNISRNLIIAQNPQANTLSPRGDTINILVSDGRSQKSYYMPSLKGLNLNKALAEIKFLGLLPGKIKYISENNNYAEDNTVFSQDPKCGFYIKEKGQVDLIVFKQKVADDKITGVYKVLTYKVSDKEKEGIIKILVQHPQELKEIYQQFHLPGDEIELLVKTGPDTKVLIYLDDNLIEEKHFD